MSPSKLALSNSYQKNIIKNSRARQIVESSTRGIMASIWKHANPMVLESWNRGIMASIWKHANPLVSELSNRESLDRHT